MITITACLIVKNEQDVIGRCLDCIKMIADEIVVVDTGSTDRTKEIVSGYTNMIYDYQWHDDFAAARNFSFTKATKDYIYVVDADEVIDEENLQLFLKLKQTLMPEIEIVQMYYGNQLQFGTTYNYDREYRPKLFKRMRPFYFKDPIHETIELEPIIYDSEIVITHKPHENHAGRDFAILQRIINKGQLLSAKLVNMYAKELFIAGEKHDYAEAISFFQGVTQDGSRDIEEVKDALCVVARAARLQNDMRTFFTACLKGVADKPCSEICHELGEYYFDCGEYKEASIWFYNAVYETECRLNIHYGSDYPLNRLADLYELLGDMSQSRTYRELASEYRGNKGENYR